MMQNRHQSLHLCLEPARHADYFGLGFGLGLNPGS
jgi:hypothetical protein